MTISVEKKCHVSARVPCVRVVYRGRLRTIVALGLLAEPREEGLAVVEGQYRGTGLCHPL